MSTTRSSKLCFAFVVAIALLRGVFLAGLIPPMGGPDEPAHFDYVQRLGETLRLPALRPGCTAESAENRAVTTALNDPIKFRPQRPMPPLSRFVAPDPVVASSRATDGCGFAAPYPPLYYASAAVGYRLHLRDPLLQRLFAARLASVGWEIVTACFAFVLGALWSGKAHDGLLLGIVVPGQPMIAHLSALVNNDAALFACATGAFAAVALIARERCSPRAFALLVATTVAGAFTKPLIAFILPVLAVAVALALGSRRPRSWVCAALAVAPAALVNVVWSLHVNILSKIPPRPDPRSWRELAVVLLNPERLYVIWHKTFWACWGWLDTWIRDDYYSALGLGMGLAAVGFALTWRRLERRDRTLWWLALAGSVFVLGTLHALELLYAHRSGQSLVQGRYLLPMFPLQALAIVAGLRALSRRFGTWFDGAWAFAALLVVVDAATIARAMVRNYA
jgi:4-amino-4-deoxy-L-arabinose transferase-like glycosyltransferase